MTYMSEMDLPPSPPIIYEDQNNSQNASLESIDDNFDINLDENHFSLSASVPTICVVKIQFFFSSLQRLMLHLHLLKCQYFDVYKQEKYYFNWNQFANLEKQQTLNRTTQLTLLQQSKVFFISRKRVFFPWKYFLLNFNLNHIIEQSGELPLDLCFKILLLVLHLITEITIRKKNTILEEAHKFA